LFIPEEKGVELVVASTQHKPKIKVIYNKRLKETKHLKDKVEEVNDIIDIKGLKAQGNQLTKLAVKDIKLLATVEGEEWPIEVVEEPISEIVGEQIDEASDDIENAVIVEETLTEGVVETETKDVVKKAKVKPTKKSKPVKDDAPVEMEWDVAPPKKANEDNPDKKKKPAKDANGEDDEGQITLF
jgi:topoisomerase-4 subunit A